jgi:hypothetical protein
MDNLLTITLPNKITVPALGGRNVEVEKIEIYEIIDNYYKKTVTALTTNHPKRIVLWEKEGYDAIGQWTDTDVINKVLELYSQESEE